jgi:hypothetical protein
MQYNVAIAMNIFFTEPPNTSIHVEPQNVNDWCEFYGGAGWSGPAGFWRWIMAGQFSSILLALESAKAPVQGVDEEWVWFSYSDMSITLYRIVLKKPNGCSCGWRSRVCIEDHSMICSNAVQLVLPFLETGNSRPTNSQEKSMVN